MSSRRRGLDLVWLAVAGTGSGVLAGVGAGGLVLLHRWWNA